MRPKEEHDPLASHGEVTPSPNGIAREDLILSLQAENKSLVNQINQLLNQQAVLSTRISVLTTKNKDLNEQIITAEVTSSLLQQQADLFRARVLELEQEPTQQGDA